MSLRESFAAIIQHGQPLAPLTHLGIGGPAELLITPRSRQELAGVVAACTAEKIPCRVLGVGTSLLVSDAGVQGAVLRLSAPCFTEIKVEGTRVRTGGGASVAAVIDAASRSGLAGFETLMGITATIGGALRYNAGDRAGEMADHMKRVEVMNERGQERIIERAELHFGDHSSDIEDPIVLSAEFELIRDKPEAIVRRLRRAWIVRKAVEPLSTQSAVRMFKNPRGYAASALIEKANVSKTRVGAVELSERNGNWLIARPGATSGDVLQLVEQVQKRVGEATGVQLERELTVW